MTSDFTRRKFGLDSISTLVDDAEVARAATYPHLIVRIHAAVYQRERIQIRKGPPAVGIHSSGATYVQHYEPLVGDNHLVRYSDNHSGRW